MALVYPLALSALLNLARVESITFSLPDASETLTTGGGEILTSQVGTRLWRGTISLQVGYHDDIELIMSRLRGLGRPGATFFASPLHQDTTTADATLAAVTNGNDVQFAGLSGTLPAGTFFEFTYGGRTGFHQTLQSVSGSGTTEVVPAIRPGWTVGTAVRFNSPRCKAVLVPKSVRDPSLDRLTGRGGSFDWIQTLR